MVLKASLCGYTPFENTTVLVGLRFNQDRDPNRDHTNVARWRNVRLLYPESQKS